MDGFRKPKPRQAPPVEPRRLVPRPPPPAANRPPVDDDATEAMPPANPAPTGTDAAGRTSAQPSGGPAGRPSGNAAGRPAARAGRAGVAGGGSARDEHGDPNAIGKRGLWLLAPIVVILGAILVGVSFASVGESESAVQVSAPAPAPDVTPTFTPTFEPVDPSVAEPEDPALEPPVLPPVETDVQPPAGPESQVVNAPTPSLPPLPLPPAPQNTSEQATRVPQERDQQEDSKPAAERSTPARQSQPAQQAPKATFSAIGGEGCTHSGASSYSVVGNDERWFTQSGGFRGAGCNGTFRAIPKSGDAGRDDAQEFVTWSFKTGAVKSGSCRTFVFVPNTSSANGAPAFYQVVKSNLDQSVVAEFSIDQKQNRGRFVLAGTFPVSDGNFAVKLRNRGSKDSGTHIAAGQVKIACTAA